MTQSTILAIETSCDETSAAVVVDGREVLSNVISSQVPVHQKYGGVVPEIASRKHVELINSVVAEALELAGKTFADLSAVAVTYGPGLVGALLVGLSTAKAMAYTLNIPLVGVNHMEGHIYANFLAHPELEFPLVCLVVSGGHSDLVYMAGHGQYEILGRTRDDAAGEAFDKIARALGLGYPGGPLVSKVAEEGDDQAILLPRAYLEPDSLDFSFSGLKSAVLNYLNRAEQKGEEVNKADLAASFQRAVTDVLVDKTMQAARLKKVKTILLAGGVAANRQLRESLAARAADHNLQVFYPPPILCTDNGAMIGAAAYFKFIKGIRAGLTLNAVPTLKLGIEEY
ncbi:MAG: tRNA (adenosine(37)-N6)-threonylcarbamoyltransferase complex transferase subunit TsaD [Clostridia bacterium]|nr:tRNA (adenosine(37)-N6)-threonylcarbamoyltransferase complex transferase subunit TsaD [Clostridia bacterium]